MEEQTKDYAGFSFDRVSFEDWLGRIHSHLERSQNGDSQLKLLERLLDITVK